VPLDVRQLALAEFMPDGLDEYLANEDEPWKFTPATM